MHEIAHPIITPEDDFKSDPDLEGLVHVLSVAIMRLFTLIKDNIHYVLFATVLNPVLFLHGLNALCTALKPHLNIPNLLSSFVEPHVDINNNHNHALAYISFIIFAQWHACQRCLQISSQRKLLRGPSKPSEEDDYWEGDNVSETSSDGELKSIA